MKLKDTEIIKLDLTKTSSSDFDLFGYVKNTRDFSHGMN